MQFFRNIARRFSGLDDNQKSYITRKLTEYGYGDSTSSGVSVSVESGLRQDTVFTAVTRIANAVAMTPFPVYRRSINGRDKAREHPVYRVLNVKSNADMTAYTWKHVSTTHLMAWGNSFSHIERNNRGDVIGLNPMHPADVKIEGRAPDGQLIYGWTDRNNERFLLRASDVLHLRGMSFDGIIGCSPILHLKEIVGRARAREDFASSFYRNGAQLGGVITIPDGLTDEQLERHRKSFQALYAGKANAGKVLLLEGTQDYKAIGVNPKDAELVDSSKLDAAKIAAAFGVPLQLLNDVATTTRASAEALFREFLMLGLNTVFTNVEQQVTISLFSEAEQLDLYAEFNRESLIQADTAVLIASLQQEVLSAIITPNEARHKLNLNSVDGGDVLLAPVNMMPIDRLGQGQVVSDGIQAGRAAASLPQERSAKQRSRGGRRRLAASYKRLLHDAYERISKRERQDIGKAARKNLRDQQAFTHYLNDYYAKDAPFADYVRKTLTPIIGSLSDQLLNDLQSELNRTIEGDSEQFAKEYLDTLLFRYTASSRRQLEKLLSEVTHEDDPADLIEQRLTEWEDGTSEVNPTRAEKESETESNRMTNALTRFFFIAAGVTQMVWRTSGEGCPICSELDGKVVGINQTFVEDGDQVGPLRASGRVFSPPLHSGCSCSIDGA